MSSFEGPTASRPIDDQESLHQRVLQSPLLRVAGVLLSATLTAGCMPANGEQTHDESSSLHSAQSEAPTPTMSARPSPSHRATALHTSRGMQPAPSEHPSSPHTSTSSHAPSPRPHSTDAPTADNRTPHTGKKTHSNLNQSKEPLTHREKACLSGMMTIAHRGMGKGVTYFGGKVYPEDTPKAFKKGLSFDVCGFETDYYFTKKGDLISQHDPNFARMTNSNEPTVDYRPGQGIHGVGGTKIVTNKEVLQTMQPYSCFKLEEIKQDNMPDEGLKQLLANAVKYAKDPRCIEFTSDSTPTLCRIKAIDPHFGTGLIWRGKVHRYRVDSVNAKCVDVLNIDYRTADKKYIQRAAERGIKVAERNIDTLALWQRAKKQGASQAITNKPWVIGGRL